MEIQSAFNSGVQGLQNAQATADKAAAEIAASTTLNANNQAVPQDTNTEVDSEVNTQLSSGTQLPDLNQSIVNLKVAEFQAKASTEVIRSADDSLGTLLDVTA